MAKCTTDNEKKYVESAKLENIIIDGLNYGKFGHDAVEILSEIYALESADVAPVVHGRWKGAGMGDYYCSLCCEEVSGNRHKFCPNCGAKMDLDAVLKVTER